MAVLRPDTFVREAKTSLSVLDLTPSLQVPRVHALHALQPLALRYQPFRAHFRPHPQTSAGKDWRQFATSSSTFNDHEQIT